MGTYRVERELDSKDGIISQTPYWVVGIVPFKNLITYDPTLLKQSDRSISSVSDPVEERGAPIVLTSEVTQLSVTSAKESHVTNMSATLLPTRNFLDKIHSGDWVMCCIVDDETTGIAVAQKMLDRKPVTEWGDGFKFIGRVSSLFKEFNIAANGTRSTMFRLDCVGFREFDSALFYHPKMETVADDVNRQMHNFGVAIENIVTENTDQTKSNTIDVNLVIPTLFNAIFSVGAWSKAPERANVNPEDQTQSATPNKKYMVPKTIFKWLGIPGSTYSDIIRIVMGLQHYDTTLDDSDSNNFGRLFTPSGLREDPEYWVFRTPYRLQGSFPHAAPPTNISAWELLSSFSNAPINEMYVTLRADENGRVLPHFVIRQNPYSTDQARAILASYKNDIERRDQEAREYDQRMLEGKSVEGKKHHVAMEPEDSQQNISEFRKALDDIDTTDFLELPRWLISPQMVTGGRVGVSDAARFNYVYIATAAANTAQDETDAFALAPPINDSHDIQRSGLRPYMTSINSSVLETRMTPGLWRDIMADIVMGQHLTLSGTINTVGIVAPIACGDNLELENIVFHIETVSHSCSIDQSGNRSFTTSLSLGHGVHSGKSVSTATPRSERFATDNTKDAGGNLNHVTKDT